MADKVADSSAFNLNLHYLKRTDLRQHRSCVLITFRPLRAQ